MGRWSRHPMGSDGALDAKDTLLSLVYDQCEENDIEFWSEEGQNLVKEFLQNISLEDLKLLFEENYLSEDRFVIPYTYLSYGINRPELRDFMIECFEYHDDITGEWNYCSELTESGEVVEMAHINYFKNNFDAIMAGEIELPDDPGLLAAIAENLGTGLINKF